MSLQVLTLQVLVKEEDRRMTLDAVLQHPWIKENADPAVLESEA
jgi:hypothetical protein